MKIDLIKPLTTIGAMILMVSCLTKEEADLIVTNARIYSVDDAFTIHGAMAVKDGKIIAMGSESEILGAFNANWLVDAEGNFIYPGFIDGHCHFHGFALNKYQYVELKGTGSYQEILEILEECKDRSAGEWILGRGWDQNDWPEKQYPDNSELDRMFPANPVMLTRIDGHAVLANSEALRLAGIDEKTKVDGGEVLLQDGHVTGILIDNATDNLVKVVPGLTAVQKKTAVIDAEKLLFAAGLTAVTDAGLGYNTIRLFEDMYHSGQLRIRLNAMLSPTQDNLENFIVKGPYLTERLTVRSLKLYADGALGSRGALLLAPYSDDPDNHGLQINTREYYKEWLQKAYDNGYQVNTHAIGDSANRLMLQLYGEILRGPNDRRWRIEHAQVVHPSDFDMFGMYSIIPSIQSTHCTSDMYWADERLGNERIKGAYAYKQLLEQNGWLVNGTDFPVEDISPLLTFYAAVARQDLEGYPEGGFQPENALSREEALRSITIWPAMGSFDEDRIGSLEVGKKADFVILDRDIMEVPIEHVPEAIVLKTFVNGEMVFEK
jgi:predicted amidohydrolase YtcJ